MKLHNILYAAGFICLIIVPYLGSCICSRVGLLALVALILIGTVFWYLAIREDGRIRKGKRKHISDNAKVYW